MAINRLNAAILPKILVEQRQHSASQSKEYELEQKGVTKEVQKESLQSFIGDDMIKLLMPYISLSGIAHLKSFDAKSFRKVGEAFDELFQCIKIRQKMSNNEMKVLRRRFNRRVGYAINHHNFICSLPEPIFRLCHFILAPMHVKPFKLFISSIIHKMYRMRYWRS